MKLKQLLNPSILSESSPAPWDLGALIVAAGRSAAEPSKQDELLAGLRKSLKKELGLDFDYIRIPSRESTKQFRDRTGKTYDTLGALDMIFYQALGMFDTPNRRAREEGRVRLEKAQKQLAALGVESKAVSSVTLNLPKKSVAQLQAAFDKKLAEGHSNQLTEKKQAIASSPHTNITLHFDSDFKQVGESGQPEASITISISTIGEKQFFRPVSDKEDSEKLAKLVQLELRKAMRNFDKRVELLVAKRKLQTR